MAVSMIIVGAIKNAIKLAGKKIIAEISGDLLTGATQSTVAHLAEKAYTRDKLSKMVSGSITDAQAVLLNRAKSYGKKAITEFLSNDMGIPIKAMEKLVKTFKQSEKMIELSKGKAFKDVAQKALEKMFAQTELKTVGKIIKAVVNTVESAKVKPIDDDKSWVDKKTDYNEMVKSTLLKIEREVKNKINGLGATDAWQHPYNIDVDFTKYFDPSKSYGKNTVTSLESALKNVWVDLEQYTKGLGESVHIVNRGNGKYDVYPRKSVQIYLNTIETMVKMALNYVGEDKKDE